MRAGRPHADTQRRIVVSIDEYAEAVTQARHAVASMLALHTGGSAALLRYERLLFTRPVRNPSKPHGGQ